MIDAFIPIIYKESKKVYKVTFHNRYGDSKIYSKVIIFLNLILY